MMRQPAELSDAEWLQAPAHGKTVYADQHRHYQRVAHMTHQLVQLAAMQDLLFGDYESLFVEQPRRASKFLGGDLRYSALSPYAWPEDPGIPPFMLFADDFVFSPLPLEGLRPTLSSAKRPLPFVFAVSDAFLAAGGWRVLNPVR
jgi:hypothetical protein